MMLFYARHNKYCKIFIYILMQLCVLDSSGESDSSDDSDIEKETASALFMVSNVIVFK